MSAPSEIFQGRQGRDDDPLGAHLIEQCHEHAQCRVPPVCLRLQPDFEFVTQLRAEGPEAV